jgi:hypothetical protein
MLGCWSKARQGIPVSSGRARKLVDLIIRHVDIVRRNCAFAQRICEWMSDPEAGGKWYTVVNATNHPTGPSAISVPLNIVMFRGSQDSEFPPSDPTSTTRLLHAINRQRLIYVTPTSWAGVGSLRIAVSNWRTGLDGDGDFNAVVEALSVAMQGSHEDCSQSQKGSQ